jgi:hypothetical protein
VVGAKAGFSRGASIGAKLFAFAQTARLEAGSAYLELLDAKDDKGRPVDPEVAAMMSSLYGLAAGGVELAALGPQMRAFGPLGEAIRSGKGIGWLKQAMADRNKAGLLKSMAKDWGASSAAEGGEGAAQAGLQFFANWTARGISAGELQSFDFAEAGGQVLESFYLEGIGGGAGAVTVGAPVSLFTNAAVAHTSRRAELVANAVGELRESPVAKESPGDAAALARGVTGHEGDYWTDAQALFDGLQGTAEQKQALVLDMLGPEGQRRLTEALERRLDEPGGRTSLQLKPEELMKLPAEVFEAIRGSLVTEEGVLTPAERQLLEGKLEDEARLAANLSRGPVLDAVEEMLD